MNKITIVGAGLTGMIAAHIFPQARILEANPREKQTPHRALLRFRSLAVSEATGIPFQQVTVRKGIWDDGFIEPNIAAANAYSMKCTGKLLPRSIWDIEACQRFIAPPNFIEQLQQNLEGRIEWGKPFDFSARRKGKEHLPEDTNFVHVISTVPMGAVVLALGLRNHPEFSWKPIHVYRCNLGDGVDVHQTVYFPFADTAVYRASITGSLLIVESTLTLDAGDLRSVIRAFNLDLLDVDQFERTQQRFGKIAPIEDGWRRNFIYELTERLGVYSLGRFGTWRNMLLDDVVHDCAVIKRLMLTDAYGQKHIRAGRA